MTNRVRPKLTEQIMLCRACDTYFRGLTNFDAHRRTLNGPPPRNLNGDLRGCVPPEAIGLHYYANRGFWGGQPLTDQQKRERGWLQDKNTPVSKKRHESPGL